eukprot:gene9483-biopygen5158
MDGGTLTPDTPPLYAHAQRRRKRCASAFRPPPHSTQCTHILRKRHPYVQPHRKKGEAANSRTTTAWHNRSVLTTPRHVSIPPPQDMQKVSGMGVSVMISSGDDGSEGECPTRLPVLPNH